MHQGINKPLRTSRLPCARPRVGGPALAATFFAPSRHLAQVRPDHDIFHPTYGPSPVRQTIPPPLGQRPDAPPPDERTLKLGKTLRTLQSRLPNLLATPLPPEILSPRITLHLFPSTHPHLPAAAGRVAYHPALWTAPVAFGRLPLLNVRLEILSERMVKGGGTPTPHLTPTTTTGGITRGGNERLIVRWRTCKKPGAPAPTSSAKMGGDGEPFCGLFIFEFDDEGRIVNHVIERAEGGEGWDQGVGRVVGLTDWLLAQLGGRGEKEVAGLALGCWAAEEQRRGVRSRGGRE